MGCSTSSGTPCSGQPAGTEPRPAALQDSCWVRERDIPYPRGVLCHLVLLLATQGEPLAHWEATASGLQPLAEGGPTLGLVRPDDLPAQALAIEAVCAPDGAGEWCGILSAIEDNGAFERGWVLGTHGDHFFFGVTGADTGRLHYIQGRTRFEEGSWHQVVGTYDGEVQRLFVDGVLDTEARVTGGAISYAEQHTLAAGSYVDADERHEFAGAIHSIRLWDQVPSTKDFKGRWDAVREGLPPRPAAFPTEELEGWPTHGGDLRRSNTTPGELPRKLRLSWTHKPLAAPSPSWGNPADQSYWQRLDTVAARVVHDRSFSPVSRDGRVFYGSSSDDGLHALDAATGKRLWTFHAEGPVRMAPFVGSEHLWFGSDDGFVYCLEVETGALSWRRRLAPEDRRIPSNGKLISPWPVRTGVAQANGVLYATAGLFPEQGCWAFALDAESGEVQWKTSLGAGLSPQGYLLLSPTRLYVPNGRSTPFALRRADGSWLGQFGGPGGTWALLTETELITGPSDQGELAVASRTGTDSIATFPGKHIVIKEGHSYLQTSKQLIALDRERHGQLTEERDALGVALTGLAEDASPSQRRSLESKLKATGRLLEECLKWTVTEELSSSILIAGNQVVLGGKGRVRSRDRETGRQLWEAKIPGEVLGLAAADGRVLATLDSGEICCLAAEAKGDPALAKAPAVPDPGRRLLPEILTGRLGFGLVVEPAGHTTIRELLETTRLAVTALVQTEEEAGRIRQDFGANPRLQVIRAGELPFTDHCMEVVVHERALVEGAPADHSGHERLLRPGTGVALFGGTPYTRPPLEGAGEWSHAFADAGNTAASMDRHASADLELQWFGGPGPEGVVDRHLRSAPPLCADGVLIVQGMDRLTAIDAYHGTTLWERSFPGLSRTGVPLDGGYQAAGGGELWLAQGPTLRCVDLRTGEDLREAKAPTGMAFGWLALAGEQVLTSLQPMGASRRDHSYEEVDLQFKNAQPLVASHALQAYERSTARRVWRQELGCAPNASLAVAGGRLYGVRGTEREPTGRIRPADLAGREPLLFALDLADGKAVWEEPLDLGRIEHSLFLSARDEHLVLTTSHTVADQPGLSGFDLEVRDSATGKLRWSTSTPNNGSGDSHGEQVHHPVLMGSTLIVEPRAYDIATGKILQGGDWWMAKRSGCGTISASADTLYFRNSNPTARSLFGETRKITSTTRPGCWINILPAAGLVLLPEASAGCVCSFSVQTSMAFLPR